MQSGWRLLRQRYDSTHWIINAVFLTIYAILSAFAAYEIIQHFTSRAYLRDHGIRDFAIVTDHQSTTGRNASNSLEYRYKLGSDLTFLGWHNAHEVSFQTYQKYPVGSRIPIVYDSRNVKRSELNTAFHSNSEFIIGAIFYLSETLFILFAVLVFPWMAMGSLATYAKNRNI